MFSLQDETDGLNAFSRSGFLHITSRGLWAATLTGGLTYCTRSISGPPPENKEVPAAPQSKHLEAASKLSSQQQYRNEISEASGIPSS